MTPSERRARLYEIAAADAEYCALKAEYDQARARFEKLISRLPDRPRKLLLCYPGMGYFLRHRMLTLACENMIFRDEE